MPENQTDNGTFQHWLLVRAEPPGHFTAHAIGLPDLHATATTRDQAIDEVRAMLSAWLASGQLVPINVPCPNPLLSFAGHLDPNDPVEKEFLEEMQRLRQQDLERSLQDDQQCPSSSSTPTI